jgi:hypothetical protein
MWIGLSSGVDVSTMLTGLTMKIGELTTCDVDWK